MSRVQREPGSLLERVWDGSGSREPGLRGCENIKDHSNQFVFAKTTQYCLQYCPICKNSVFGNTDQRLKMITC
jgi:hypothetical protein